MTREEAITHIDAMITTTIILRGVVPDEYDIEALRMAIKALQAQPTHGRLIDADALSKKLCGTTIFIKDGEVFQRMINDAPTEQAETVHKPDYSYETDMARRLIEETLKNKLQELAQCDDYEMAHMKADKLLCDFITKLGYGEVAQKFDAVPKWYA